MTSEEIPKLLKTLTKLEKFRISQPLGTAVTIPTEDVGDALKWILEVKRKYCDSDALEYDLNFCLSLRGLERELNRLLSSLDGFVERLNLEILLPEEVPSAVAHTVRKLLDSKHYKEVTFQLKNLSEKAREMR
ncbi:MAG: hypothetical protein JRN68_09645 [Nitrososphaerota archaeon]|nr:hypothetical protein [Nitrososphaerota archaeon]